MNATPFSVSRFIVPLIAGMVCVHGVVENVRGRLYREILGGGTVSRWHREACLAGRAGCVT